MKDNFLLFVLPLVVVLLILQTFTLAQREIDPCRLFSDGTKVRDPDDCSQALTCVDFKSVLGKKCSGSTPFYDKDKDACAKSLTDHSLCNINCTKSEGAFVEDPKSCFGYYFCQDKELALYGHCPTPTHFNQTRQECIHTDESYCTVKSLNYCAIVKDGVNFKDESTCAKYHVCKKGVLSSGDCSKTGYYQAATGKCVQKSLVDCPAHPLPKNVCGTVKSPKKNKYASDGATCRGYYFCAAVEDGPDPDPTWHQCPANTFYSDAKQKCINPLDVACSEDRCDGRSLTFVSDSTKGCRHFLRCNNGITTEKLTCGNMFFNEIEGVCTGTIVKYPSCS